MRFEFAIAAKYLIPRLKQLSTSIISLLSILVISLVVWLILVFLSVTDGLEKMWLDKLIALNAPLRLTPTDDYYKSYYYKIDSLSDNAHYHPKTLQEKRVSTLTDPYEPGYDPELPPTFPKPDTHSDGSLKDIVKETFSVIHSLDHLHGLTAEPYEVALSQFHLRLSNEDNNLTNVAYIASLPANSPGFKRILSPPAADDVQNMLSTLHLSLDGEELPFEIISERFQTFFNNVQVTELKTSDNGWRIPYSLLPKQATFNGLAIIKEGKINRVILSSTEDLAEELIAGGYVIQNGSLHIDNENFYFNDKLISHATPLILWKNFYFEAALDLDSLKHATRYQDLYFHIKGIVEGDVPLSQGLLFSKVIISKDQNLWLNASQNTLALPEGGAIVPKMFKDNGIRLGDRGYLSYQAPTGSAVQEMHTPIFVAGFYDPGVMSVGGKLLIVNPEVATLIRSATGTANQPLGTGIQIWFDDLDKALQAKQELIFALQNHNLASYWHVESFQEYDFAKDLVQQLKSDKNLFTLLALIIIVVACSNIISMLVLLVNDKKKEIGILQSMGASPSSIALIFGSCGVIMGLASSLIGTLAAFITLHYLQNLVNFLSALQGFDAFNTMFYGESLPDQMSTRALGMVWIATSIISLLAGLIPAIKAGLMKPTAILRAE